MCRNKNDVSLKEILWIYIPDFEKEGKITSIKSIPNKLGTPGDYWQETSPCAGFTVQDDCPWRYEEMSLISFTPQECRKNKEMSCEHLISYIRYQNQNEKQEEAMMQFFTTVFTCIVLSFASLTVSRDIEVIVIEPIKKIVDII